MLIPDLIKIIGINKPCIYLAARGEVTLYCVGTRTNKTQLQYELLAITNEHTGEGITAWYDADDNLSNFILIDYME